MANDKNLVSLADRTTSEQRAIATMGGVASGAARRQRKTLREICREMLAQEIKMADGTTISQGALVVAKQIEKAQQEKDTYAAKFVAELSGDMQQQIAISTDTETAAAIREEFAKQYAKE